eukprot:1305631-Pyramimonas_sp.AAC.1
MASEIDDDSRGAVKARLRVEEQSDPGPLLLARDRKSPSPASSRKGRVVARQLLALCKFRMGEHGRRRRCFSRG